MPHGVNGVRGLDGLDLTARGIPDERALLERYCEGAGRDGINDWPVFLAFALFRSAAILQGCTPAPCRATPVTATPWRWASGPG